MPGFRPRSLWAEFKEFAFKGNMIDLAVGVVIGLAFKTVVDAIVGDLIMPVVSWVQPKNGGGYESWVIARIRVGEVISAFINFVVVAAAVFLLVKLMRAATVKRNATPGEPTTKECPRCLSMIPLRANKCAHCTADLPEIPVASSSAIAK